MKFVLETFYTNWSKQKKLHECVYRKEEKKETDMYTFKGLNNEYVSIHSPHSMDSLSRGYGSKLQSG